jgi:hypothetical protein
MRLLHYSLFILCVFGAMGVVIGMGTSSEAAVQNVILRDITPRSLLSHSAIDLDYTRSILVTLGAGNKLLNVYDIHDVFNPRRRAIYELPAQGVSKYLHRGKHGLCGMSWLRVSCG